MVVRLHQWGVVALKKIPIYTLKLLQKSDLQSSITKLDIESHPTVEI
jgi:hypothetical protein